MKKKIQKSLSLSHYRALFFHCADGSMICTLICLPLSVLLHSWNWRRDWRWNHSRFRMNRPTKVWDQAKRRFHTLSEKKDNGNSTEMRNNDEKSARTMKQIEIDQSSNIGSGAHSWRSVHQNNFLKLKRTKTVNDWNAKAIAPKTNKSNTQKIHFVNSSKNRSSARIENVLLGDDYHSKAHKNENDFSTNEMSKDFFLHTFLKTKLANFYFWLMLTESHEVNSIALPLQRDYF